MQSVCRNVTVSGRRTSIRMEPLMWDSLVDICAREGRSVHDVSSLVDRCRGDSSLTAALRVFILSYYRAAVELGMRRAAATTGMAEEQAAYDGPGYSDTFRRAIEVFTTPVTPSDINEGEGIAD